MASKSKIRPPRERLRVESTSLADALFTSTQQRVLALLFGQPHKSYFVTQIMGLAQSGRGAVQRELSRLEQSGLVTVKRVATQKHYQANPGSPLFNELCGIIRKTVGLQEPVRKAIEELSDKIVVAFLYGSTAKGTDSSGSDIDLLIVSDTLLLEDVYSSLAQVETTLDRVVNPTIYSSKEFDDRRRRKNSFLSRVLKGPVTMLLGSIDDT